MKLPKVNPSVVVPIIIIILMVVTVGILAALATHPNPLDAYITQRNCQFIQFADLSAAVCADGTTWLVSTLKP